MTSDYVQRVRIYLSENDTWDSRPLYIVVLEQLQREGATGATAIRGLTGFGPGQRLRSSGFVLSDHDPIVIEWIDRPDRVGRILPLLNDLLPQALITREEIEIYRAVLLPQGPFSSERTVGDLLVSDVQTLPQSATVDLALTAMLRHQQETIPILDDQRRVLAVVTAQDVHQRAGLRLPLRLMSLLSEDERDIVLMHLGPQPLGEMMDIEPHNVYEGASLPQALITMIEWDYEQVPVVDRDGIFLGLLSCNSLLHTVVEQQSSDENEHVKDAETSTPIRLIMQSSVPRARLDQPVGEALKQLLATTSRHLIVVDEGQRVVGSLSDTGVLQRIDQRKRGHWLNALQRPTPQVPADLLDGLLSLRALIDTELVTVPLHTRLLDAIRVLVETHCDRMPVIDEEGRLAGLLTRTGLLRALLQETQR
jgi:CBS-domain-containing membrane protein